MYRYIPSFLDLLPTPLHILTAQKHGCEEVPLAQGRGSDREDQAVAVQECSRGASPHLGSGVAAERSFPAPEVRGHGREEQPHLQDWLLHRHRRAERSYSTFKVRRGGREKKPLVQGKRNPSKMVDVVRGHQRADTLKP